MKVLTHLTATTVDAPWNEPYNIVSSVHVEPAPGQFGAMQLGGAGLTLRIGQAVAGIPLDELMAVLVPAAAASDKNVPVAKQAPVSDNARRIVSASRSRTAPTKPATA